MQDPYTNKSENCDRTWLERPPAKETLGMATLQSGGHVSCNAHALALSRAQFPAEVLRREIALGFFPDCPRWGVFAARGSLRLLGPWSPWSCGILQGSAATPGLPGQLPPALGCAQRRRGATCLRAERRGREVLGKCTRML